MVAVGFGLLAVLAGGGAAAQELAAGDLAGLERPRLRSCGPGSRGWLRSATDFHHYSSRSLEDYWDSWLVGEAALGYVDDTVEPDIRNGAVTFKVTYCTVDFDGSPIVASGMVALPRTFRRSPTVVYSHGTAVTRFDTPSNPDVDDRSTAPRPW